LKQRNSRVFRFEGEKAGFSFTDTKARKRFLISISVVSLLYSGRFLIGLQWNEEDILMETDQYHGFWHGVRDI
jgi:hypothetical protein